MTTDRRSPSRRGVRSRAGGYLLILLLLVPLAATVGAGQVQAQEAIDAEDYRLDPAAGVIDVLQVSGLVDPLVADFITDRIEAADPATVKAIVLQVNSRGDVLPDDELQALAETISNARVPVGVWIGPSNARALGSWVALASRADRVGIAEGAKFGEVSGELAPLYLDARAGLNAVQNDTVSADEAVRFGLADVSIPTVGDFLIGLQDLGIETVVLNTEDGPRTITAAASRFQRLSLLAQQLHTAASPPVAYLLFTIGLALLVFEFYTAGVGVAGVVGAGMFLLGCFGLYTLPVSLVAVALIVVAMLAFSVDVQTGVPRFWTIVGVIALAVGTLTLYREGVSMSWIPMVVGIVGITLMMVTGMPTMVRTRFSTPTIGRDWMIGSLGRVVDSVSPDGVVMIDEALWKARTNRATPALAGEVVRVVSVDGLVLEVEPEQGGARDYRERRS